MEAKVSEILENILGLLALEGSFEVEEGVDEITVSIDASDTGRLIGYKGETVDSLQLLVNQILGKQSEVFKRVVIDVGGWRKSKEGELENKARKWAEEVKESGHEMELEPMPSWQRRIIHLIIEEIDGVESESVGEGRERHLIIKIPHIRKSAQKERTKVKDTASVKIK